MGIKNSQGHYNALLAQIIMIKHHVARHSPSKNQLEYVGYFA